MGPMQIANAAVCVSELGMDTNDDNLTYLHNVFSVADNVLI